ncbi:MAG: DNA polymerase III subunit delta [Flammeovirgaceae bacterium]|nr:DNA polymerase III subunit delta [Flammeovirgaceae bacterium]
MRFEEIPGLLALKEILVLSHQRNHMAHAQLFSGQEGGAALPLAIAYATYLLCENKASADACGSCSACQKMAKHIHPDVHYFFPSSKSEKEDGKQQTRVSEVWRKFIIEQPYAVLGDLISVLDTENKQNQISKEEAKKIVRTVSMKSFEGGLKILIIWYPEKMNSAAANAILKVLEEPPENTLYLMVTYHYEDLLTTIISRLQLVTIPSFSEGELTGYLVNNHGATAENAIKAYRFSNGSLPKAVADLEEDNEDELHWFIDWMRNCIGAKYDFLSQMSEKFKQISRAKQQIKMRWALEMIRNAILVKGAEDLISAQGAERVFILKFSNAINLQGLELIYKDISETLYYLERHAHPQMAQLALSIRLSHIIRANRG